MKKLLFGIGIFTAALSGVFASEEKDSSLPGSQQCDNPTGQKKPSFFAIVDSIQGLMPLKDYSYLNAHLQIWPKEKPYDWKQWRRHIKNRLSFDLHLIGQSLIALTLMNGVVNLVKGITLYPNSVETWKRFFADSIHFRQNQKELSFIQNIELMRCGLWHMFLGCTIGFTANKSLDEDLLFFLQGTLIGATKMGLIYAAVVEILHTVFTRLNCVNFVNKLSIDERKKLNINCKIFKATRNMCQLIHQLTPVFFNSLFMNPSWKQLSSFFHFGKEWNVYALLNSLYYGIKDGIDIRQEINTWYYFKNRIVRFFLFPFIQNSLLVGVKNGLKYAALQFGVTEFLYRALTDSNLANFRELYI